MILLVSNERDLTTDYIVLALQRRKIPYFRLNTERLAAARMRCQPAESLGLVFEFEDRILHLSDVSAGYFRRPAMPVPKSVIDDPAERSYCCEEWNSILRSLYSMIGERWLNSPVLIAIAEDKPLQLSVAAATGLRVPETFVTNDPDAGRAFIQNGPTVVKSLHSSLIGEEADGSAPRVIFTNRISNAQVGDPIAFEAAPVILQREIPKAMDIRTTVVGSHVFAASIDSQSRSETSVDWRRGSHLDLPHEAHELPKAIADRCAKLVRNLGLRFAAIDLVLDPRGEYWFLEANPNGQWAWIEHRTGLPISSAIVDELIAIGNAPNRTRSR